MVRYAILCGSAPEDFRQKKLVSMHDSLLRENGDAGEKKEIMIFPNGVAELMLECALNDAFDEASGENSDEADCTQANEGEVLLYFCARSEADLNAELSDSAVRGIEVVRLGSDEIRKDVIAYYADLAGKLEVKFRVLYEADAELVSEEVLGYEKVV